MNVGLLGFPTGGPVRPYPYRFLDTYGLPQLPGDVSRFSAVNTRADAGAALPGVWRPIDATNDATLAVERGCLVVSQVPMAAPSLRGAGVYIQVAGDFDAVAVLLVEPPIQFPGSDDESYAAGVFAGVDDSAVGYCVTCVDSEVLGATLSRVQDIAVTSFTLDPTLAELTLAPSSAPCVTAWAAPLPLLVRVKRIGVAIRTYFSADGFTWRESDTGSSRIAGLNAALPGYIGVVVNAQMTTPAGVIKAMVPEIKFLDPTTAFLS